MRRRAATLMLMAGLLVAACSCGSDKPSDSAGAGPGTPIADGFVVADGGHMVGPVFHFRRSAEETGWRALIELDVDRADPFGVYDAYVAQGRRLDYLISGSGTSVPPNANNTVCSLEHPDFFRTPIGAGDPSKADALMCQSGGGSTTDPYAGVSLEMRWGGTAHHIVLEWSRYVSNTPLQKYDLGDQSAPRLTSLPSLTTAPEVQVGQPFGVRNDAFSDGYGRYRLEAGSAVAGEADRLSGNFIAVLRITGDAEDVMRGYAHQLGRDPTMENAPAEVKKVSTPAGEILAIDYGPIGGGGTTLFTDPTRRWLMVQAVSD